MSGSVPGAATDPTYTAATVMGIASASKWLYGAYVAQKRAGGLTDTDIRYLTLRSGYTDFSTCPATQSVDACVAYQSNGVQSAANDGFFYDGGGHMQNHAAGVMALGPLVDASLATEIQAQIGSDVAIDDRQPQLAGGVHSSADQHARFLRKLLGGQLQRAALLGSHAVCTNPPTCAQARSTPVPSSESWHCAIAHGGEDDPVVGDGAFSSGGAFGVYPWIDAGKTWCGVLAREVVSSGEGFVSANCGRAIRKAFVTGVAQ